MSQGVLSPLTNHASMSIIGEEASTSFAPRIPSISNHSYENKESGAFNRDGKGSVIKRDSIAFKMDQNNQAYRNNKNSIQYSGSTNSNATPLGGGGPNKQFDTNNTN